MNADTLRAQATVNFGGNPGWPSPAGEMAPTLEECELLYALVRALKPQLVYESGTGNGYSAAFLASALVENEAGTLLTHEPEPEYAARARANLAYLPVEVIEQPWTGNADLVYLDSAPGIRENEIVWWLKSRLAKLIVVHDANRDYVELRVGVGVILPTAYGLWVGRPA